MSGKTLQICCLSVALTILGVVQADESKFPEPCCLPQGVAFGFDASVRAFSLVADDIEVDVDGRRREARAIRVSAHPFNRVWPGYQRSRDQTEPASYLAFEKNSPAAFRIRPKWGCTNAVVRPLSAGVGVTVEDGVVSFVLPRPGYYSVEFDGTHRALHVFMDPVCTFSERTIATRTFGPGVHVAGIVKVQSGDRIYIDRSAIVFGAFHGENVRDVKIFGGGVIDGSVCERIFDGCFSRLQPHGIHFYESQGIVIDGPILVNSACWCAAFFDCEDIELSRLKIVGQWRYNTDGIDVCNSRRVRIHDCFVRAFDDVVVVKGIPPFAARPVEDISVERCVLWCGWGNTCEPGIETFAFRYRDVRFEDCDLIHNAGIALDVACGAPTCVENITYRNMRVELQNDTEPMVLQRSDSEAYDSKGGIGRPVLIAVRNDPWSAAGGGGSARNVMIDGIDVYADPGVPKPDVRISAKPGRDGRPVRHENLVIRNIRINGRPFDWEHATLERKGE